jgi:hypothetical protein
MNPLDNLEKLAQRFVEGTFHRFFNKKMHPADLADQLIESIEAGRNGRENDLLPASYKILVSSSDYGVLLQQNNIEGITSELVAHLTTYVNESDCQFGGSLQIVLDQDEAVPPGQVKITASEPVDRGRL